MTTTTATRKRKATGAASGDAAARKGPRRLLAGVSKGGCGKTFLSRSLAVCAAAMDGLDVAIADFDPQRSTVRWVSRRPADAARITVYDVDIGSEADMREILDLTAHDLIIYDPPPTIESFPEQLQRMIVASDLILVPTNDCIDDYDQACEFMEMVRSYGKPSAFVLNQIDRRATTITREAKQHLVGFGDLCPFEIPTSVDQKHAAKLGRAITEIRGATGREEVVGVWAFARTRLGMGG